MNRIDAVLLDASHDYEAVLSDIAHVLRLPHVQWVAFDDYSAEPGVQAAVRAFVDAGRLAPLHFLGEERFAALGGPTTRKSPRPTRNTWKRLTRKCELRVLSNCIYA